MESNSRAPAFEMNGSNGASENLSFQFERTCNKFCVCCESCDQLSSCLKWLGFV